MKPGDRFTDARGNAYTILEVEPGNLGALVHYRRNGDEGRVDARSFHHFLELGFFKPLVDEGVMEARLELAFRRFLRSYHRGVPGEKLGVVSPMILAKWCGPDPWGLTEEIAKRAWEAAKS